MSPEHLISLAPGWTLWRTFCLRSTGFPARIATQLATSVAAHAIDAHAAHEAELGSVLTRAAEAAVDAMRASSRDDERAALKKAARALRAGKCPEIAPAPIAREVEIVRAALEHQRALEAAALAAFAKEGDETVERLRDLAQDPRFREALTWQNPRLVADALDPYVERPGADFKSRQRALLIASYAQRYALKNESVGFFGPIGWGRFVEEGPPITLEPGDSVATELTAHLEVWAVDAVLDAVAHLPGMRPWIPPRRSPLIRVEGATIHSPFGPFDPPPLHARVLAACDGDRPAREIAALCRDGAEEVTDEDVYRALEALEKQDVVFWHFELVTCTPHCEQTAREALDRIGDEALRAQATALLDRVLAARDGVQAAAGAVELAAALERLDREFTEITGTAATRNAGKTYAARTLVRSIARRPVTLDLGPDVLRKLASPLALLATSARWWSERVADAYVDQVSGVARELRRTLGTEELALMHVWPQIAPLFPRAGGTDLPPAVAAINAEHARLWAEILRIGDRTERRLHVRVADIEPAVLARFAANAPGWPAARCHSPDLMIAASSAEAIARGELTVVLGETHFFVNTIEQLLFVSVHPDGEALRRAFTLDQAAGRLTPAGFAGGSHDAFSTSPRDGTIEHDQTRSWRPREQVFPISDLVVVEVNGEISVTTRDRRRSWSLRAAINSLFSTANVADILEPAAHMPRVTFDDLVVMREAWRFSTSEIAFAQRDDALDRFKGARAWARAHGMPRYCFYRSSAEMKPCFLDFESAVFVEAFAKAVRSSDRVAVSEMLPTPDQCWLVDRDGERYSCELRTVLVDERAHPVTPLDR